MPDPTTPPVRRRPPGASGPRRGNLSEAEIEVISRYARGWTADRIAEDLDVSPETVRTRTARASARVGINGARTPGLVDYAYRNRLIPLTPLPFTKDIHERLLDVLVCLADGLGDRATANRLNIKRSTSRSHRRRLFEALGVEHHGAGAAPRAVSMGWELGILGPEPAAGTETETV